MKSAPPLIWLLNKFNLIPPPFSLARLTYFRWLVFVLTFITYASFHASRKPISVVKNVLNRNCSGLVPPPTLNTSGNIHWCDWAPFDGDNSNTLLGVLDSTYLFSYAVFMYFSGMLAERMDLRYFLALTMLGSGLFTWAFGVAYFWQIHSLAYFIVIQIVCGVFQAGGWPGVVAVMAYWQDNSKRGLIFGLWNSHTSLGNILGTLIASAFVSYNWGLSFVIPGLVIGVFGLVNFLLLTPYPADVDCPSPISLNYNVEDSDDGTAVASGGDAGNSTKDESRGLLRNSEEPGDDTTHHHHISCGDGEAAAPTTVSGESDRAVSFLQALAIPGVVPFSFSLFFAKLVSYTFLYWLPRYLHSVAGYSASESANISTLFDVGGIVGGILAGVLSDWTRAPAIVCFILLLLAIPVMYIMQLVSTVSHLLNSIMLLSVGVLVNGPYALITTAVSADLGGSHTTSKAMATVTAIIDGTGSVGAALGPLLAGAVSSGNHWDYVFYMLMTSNLLSMICLVSVMKQEWTTVRGHRDRQ